MQQDVVNQDQLFQLRPSNKQSGGPQNVLSVGRYLVGRSESCDIIIQSPGVSAIHAVLEIDPMGLKIFDMNSTNGTFVNGKKIVVENLSLNARIIFGHVEFIITKYVADPALPPVLSNLDPIQGNASVLKTNIQTHLEDSAPELPVKRPVVSEESDIPYIVYPLAADPESDYSEYIFEDTSELYPIFKYDIGKQAFEVIILFKDQVYSVDYLPEKDGLYQIAGLTKHKKEIEFPYLGKEEKFPFIEVRSGNCLVNQLHRYELIHLVKDKVITSTHESVNIQANDIVKLKNGDLEIYIRRVSSPPKVKPAPFFRRDKDLKKYVFLMVILVLLPVLAFNLYEVDEDLEDEKDPERIATVLYKKKMFVAKTKAVAVKKKAPVKKQKQPKKKVVKKKEPKKAPKAPEKKVVKPKPKPTPSKSGSKTAKKVQDVKKVKRPAPKRNNNSKTATANAKTKSATKSGAQRRANTPSKSQGKVDVYKSFDFKSTVSSLMAKGGSLKGARTAQTNSGSVSSGSSISGGVETNLQKAAIGDQVGSLSGSATGKLGVSKGTQGLSSKSGIYTAGIPSNTVVLGSIDPDIIRRILRDNIPFFRGCYQKELDRNAGSNVSGIIQLIFTIGPSGHVTKAGVGGSSRIPANVKRCVTGVLRGIKFPEPRGGGTADVKQPFNFSPKRL